VLLLLLLLLLHSGLAALLIKAKIVIKSA